MSSREYTIIHTTKTKEECLEIMAYPFGYINYEYEDRYILSNIRRPILMEGAAEMADAGDFPNNVDQFFWVVCGERDEAPWICCGLLTNGAFFLYTGSCDYTGFDCQGGMNLWVSNSWKNIVDHAMTQSMYEQYRAQNEPEEDQEAAVEEEAEDRGICSHCHDSPATMPNEFSDEEGDLCADCYWDIDAQIKRERRADPSWRASRVYSTAKVLLGKSEEEARAMAMAAVAEMKK